MQSRWQMRLMPRRAVIILTTKVTEAFVATIRRRRLRSRLAYAKRRMCNVAPDWRPMSEFDPDEPARVHDRLNDQVIEWDPQRHGRDWHQAGHCDFGNGIIEWDGLLLDGWMERRSRLT